jgi:hypothetical protein
MTFRPSVGHTMPDPESVPIATSGHPQRHTLSEGSEKSKTADVVNARRIWRCGPKGVCPQWENVDLQSCVLTETRNSHWADKSSPIDPTNSQD